MDPIIFTPRLKLTLVTKAERGSQELEWMHELRSNAQTTFWSIYGQSKSIEETEKIIKSDLPASEGEEYTYRVHYAVHKILEPTSYSVEGEQQPLEQGTKQTEFIGVVNVKSVSAGSDASRSLAVPEELVLPASAAATTLTVEVGYSFLPTAWGKGYATESVEATFEACRRAQSFWAPFPKVYVRSIVHEDNVASLRVMEKTGMAKRGVYEWTGEAIFHGGEWRPENSLHIFGMYLLG